MDEQLLRQIVDKFRINPSVLTDGTEGSAWATGEAKKMIISTNRKINMKATEEQNEENRMNVELLEYLMKALKVKYKGGKANIKKFDEASKSIDRYRQAVQEPEPEPEPEPKPKPKLIVPEPSEKDDPENNRKLPVGRYVTQEYISPYYPRGFLIMPHTTWKTALSKLTPEEYSQLRTVPFPRGENKRCPRGFRVNKETGLCENTKFRGGGDEELLDVEFEDLGEISDSAEEDEEPYQSAMIKYKDEEGIWHVVPNPDFIAGDGAYGGVGDEYVEWERPHVDYEDLIPSEKIRWDADWAEWEADEDAQGEFSEMFDDWRESDYRKDRQLYKAVESMVLEPIVSSTPTITAEPEEEEEEEKEFKWSEYESNVKGRGWGRPWGHLKRGETMMLDGRLVNQYGIHVQPDGEGGYERVRTPEPETPEEKVRRLKKEGAQEDEVREAIDELLLSRGEPDADAIEKSVRKFKHDGKDYLIDRNSSYGYGTADVYDPITHEHVGIWNGSDIEDVATDESSSEDDGGWYAKETYEEHTDRVMRDIAFRELERMTSEERDAHSSPPPSDLYADMMGGKSSSEEDTSEEDEEFRQLISEFQATGRFDEDEVTPDEALVREVLTATTTAPRETVSAPYDSDNEDDRRFLHNIMTQPDVRQGSGGWGWIGRRKPVSPPSSPKYKEGKPRRLQPAQDVPDDYESDSSEEYAYKGVRRGGGKQKGAGRRPQQADWRETGTESGFQAFQQHQIRERLKEQMREQGTLASSVLTPPPSTPTPTAEEAEFAERMREGFATAPRRADLIVPTSFGTQVTDVPSGF